MGEMDRLGATRFMAGGPALPDRLLADQLRGDVLFICGAGVSMTAGLPSFRELARKVYGTLGEDWTGHVPEAGAMAENGPYSGQYDRMFRSLERPLAASDTREAPGMRQRLLEPVASHLRVAVGAALPNHEALLALSRGKDGVARLLTTNFDLLLECAGDSGGERIERHAGSSLPRPGTAAFEGVLHIHGRIAEGGDGRPASDLVLSSVDFGDPRATDRAQVGPKARRDAARRCRAPHVAIRRRRGQSRDSGWCRTRQGHSRQPRRFGSRARIL